MKLSAIHHSVSAGAGLADPTGSGGWAPRRCEPCGRTPSV